MVNAPWPILIKSDSGVSTHAASKVNCDTKGLVTDISTLRSGYMMRHVYLMEKAWNMALDTPDDGQLRLNIVNYGTHKPDVLGDAMLAEATGDVFRDLLPGTFPSRDHDKLYEAAYNISHEKLTQMRQIIDQGNVHLDIINLYRWCVEYVDRFHLWRDATLQYLRPHNVRYYNSKTIRWSMCLGAL